MSKTADSIIIDWANLPEGGMFDDSCPFCGNRHENFEKEADTNLGKKKVMICNKCSRVYKKATFTNW